MHTVLDVLNILKIYKMKHTATPVNTTRTTIVVKEIKKTNGMQKTMKALVYHGPGKKSWEDKPKPVIKDNTDVIVKVLKTTICGTDLHILKGDVPEVTQGRILGHEGVGVIEETGQCSYGF